jgi:NADP-dependent 3-hydroxy acid dehydrogenase YdfG
VGRCTEKRQIDTTTVVNVAKEIVMARGNTLSAAVTGAGSGLGRDIALGLAAKNYRVFGTAMRAEEIGDLQQASGGTVALSHCDITDEGAVKRWAHDVATQTDSGLDLSSATLGS